MLAHGIFQNLPHSSVTLPRARRYRVGAGLQERTKGEIDLVQLRKHLREKPRTKAGQVRQAWPQIRELLDHGHSLKDIWQWLIEAGIEIGYARLSDYVCQLRRREEAAIPAISPGTTANAPVEATADKPLAQFLEREKRKTAFAFDPDRKSEDLI